MKGVTETVRGTLSPARTPAEAVHASMPQPAQVFPTVIRQLRTAVNHFLPHARYQLLRLGPAGLTGAVASSAALVIGAFALLSLHAANEHLLAQISQGRHHRPGPVITPQQDLLKVVSHLPMRSQMPVVMGQVLQQARAAGVELTKGQYTYSSTAPSAGGLGRYELDFPLKAAYPGVRDFINRTLTAVPSAGLFKLSIERKSIGDGEVNADVRFVIFVRNPEPLP
jgi:hypothetical protein